MPAHEMVGGLVFHLSFLLFSSESREYRRFPDESGSEYEYFISELNFEAVDGNIVVGAA